MKTGKIIEILSRWCDDGRKPQNSDTCDTVKHGDFDRDVSKVAVTMVPTVEVLRKAIAAGIEFLIVHEPLYFNHYDESDADDAVVSAKKALVESSGMVIWRFHDHPHCKEFDMIAEGNCRNLKLEGEFICGKNFGKNRFVLEEPLSAEEIGARFIAAGAENVRICGERKRASRYLSLCFGAPGDLIDELSDPGVEVVLTGEACEWRNGEYARDAAALGFNKSLIFIGHVASEREGVCFLRDKIAEMIPELEVSYIECGEPY